MRASSSSRSKRLGRQRPRPDDHAGRRRSRAACRRPRSSWSTQMSKLPSCRRAAHRGRSAAARDRHQAAHRPRRQSRRDDRGAVQAIRIATLGDIDQNSAKFSLSDRQIPIRVALDRECARRRCRRSRTCRCRPRAADRCRSASSPRSASARARPQIERVNQQRRIDRRRRSRAGRGHAATAMTKIDALPSDEEPAASACAKLDARPGEVAGRDDHQLHRRGDRRACFLVFAVLVLLYRRLLPPFVNMGSLLLAPLGGAARAADLTGNADVDAGVHRHADAARHRRQELDPADRFRARGDEQGRRPSSTAIIDAGHKRAQPIVMTTVAMVAGMVPTALSLSRRRLVARADGHHRDRRADRCRRC